MESKNKEYYIGERRTKWQNRAQGLTSMLLGGLFMGAGIKKEIPLLTIAGSAFITDGIVDTISGYHHYVYVKASEYIKSGIQKINSIVN